MKKVIFLNKYLVLRYLISGGISSAIDIIIFYLLTKEFGFHYIFSAFISVTVSFVIRFYLQKVFAFRDRNIDIHRQVAMYTILYALSLTLTTVLLYIFIDMLHIWFVLAQIMAIGVIAVLSFFVYRHIIFKKVDIDIIQKL